LLEQHRRPIGEGAVVLVLLQRLRIQTVRLRILTSFESRVALLSQLVRDDACGLTLSREGAGDEFDDSGLVGERWWVVGGERW